MSEDLCSTCGAFVAGARAATGHLVGAAYTSVAHGMRYVVEAIATKWECAPGAAVRLTWDNGNVTVTDAAVADGDAVVCATCASAAVAA